MSKLNYLSDYTPLSIIEDKAAVEAGYVNNPDDSGGETNRGITKALADGYKDWLIKEFGWDGKMKSLTHEMAVWIYQTHFWNRLNGDQVIKRHPLIADKLFDISINTGVTNGVKILQRILTANNNRGKLYPDLKPDGGMGTLTLKGLDNYISVRKNEGIQRLLCAMLCEQGSYYLELVERREKDEEFYYGWTGRVTRDMGHYAKLLGIAV